MGRRHDNVCLREKYIKRSNHVRGMIMERMRAGKDYEGMGEGKESGEGRGGERKEKRRERKGRDSRVV